MSDAAISIDSVTKEFRIYRERAPSAKERLIHFGRNPHETFKALDDVSIEVPEGRTFALLGHNGSGKSTLLKCITGTLRPNAGRIVTRGRLAALLELGAGFHPDLTGRENIYLNGSILGFSAKQVDTIFDEIVEFAELHDFIDNQVKTYSSGMYARLGFSVAINVDPEILLVDEVLSVGDEAFQRKCIDRVRALQGQGRTIVLVTHSAVLVRKIADQAAVLDHGRLVAIEEPGEAIRILRETLARRGIALSSEQIEGGIASEGAAEDDADARPRWSGPPPKERPEVTVEDPVTITDGGVEYPNPDARYLLPGQPIRLRVDYITSEKIEDIAVTFDIFDEDDELVFGTDTELLNQPIVNLEGVGAVCFDFDDLPLLEGRYRVDLALTTRTGAKVHAERSDLATFEIVRSEEHRGFLSLEPTVVHFYHNGVPQEPAAEPDGPVVDQLG